MKRLLSIFLICAMVITMVPAVGFAADTGKAIQPDTGWYTAHTGDVEYII